MVESNDLVIFTQGLGKTYKNVVALKGLNLKVTKHSIFGFLGPNGAGKTTTIKLLLGLARPTEGNGEVFGCDIRRSSLEIRKHTGYLAQDPRYFEHLTARETLRFTARFFYSGPAEEIEARISEMLDLVGLEEKADRPIKGFSGGERQRLGLAQAQINYPDLLILDEPAASLDPQGRRDVLEVMERLRKHSTIFYSTHILDDVQRVSDTVAILNHGELVAQAPIQELLAGSGGTVYRMRLKEILNPPSSEFSRQPWVSSVHVSDDHGQTVWQVSVKDPDAAENQLLRLVLDDPQIMVTEFGLVKHDLEEIFLKIVEGGQHGER